jgi:Tfp pilus assembly protein PilN
MSNLLPPFSQKNMRAQFRARFLLVTALALLCGALVFALALLPAEAALISFTPPGTEQGSTNAASVATDTAALAHTKALLTQLSPLDATSSLDAVAAALSQAGLGITINDISYSVTSQSLSLAGKAQSPDDVNTFRQALESDLRFTNVSVPVSALLGSENGNFTITMDIAN